MKPHVSTETWGFVRRRMPGSRRSRVGLRALPWSAWPADPLADATGALPIQGVERLRARAKERIQRHDIHAGRGEQFGQTARGHGSIGGGGIGGLEDLLQSPGFHLKAVDPFGIDVRCGEQSAMGTQRPDHERRRREQHLG